MWTSSMLKQNAKNGMKPYFWTAVGVLIVMSIISGVVSYIASLIPTFALGSISLSDIEDNMSPEFWIYYLVTLAISIAVAILLTNILEIGKCRFFYHGRNGDTDFGNLFWAFQGGRYKPCVSVMFQRYLEILLWSLLFIIPGYIKMFEYFLVPYLLAENPKLSKQRALQISKQTMDGEKMNLFLMQLSFIGWMLLGVITCYLGLIYAIPYYEATMTEFYACMRAKMLSLGITSEAELSGDDYFNNGFGGGYPENNFNNPNPYDNQNAYQNPNSYQQPQSPYQDNNTHVNLNKNPYDDNQNGF